MTKIEIDVNTPGKRFRDALAIQAGAVNPSGIARSLAAACKECLDNGVDQRTDPAVRLIVHQLAFICNVRELDESMTAYGVASDICRNYKPSLDAEENGND